MDAQRRIEIEGKTLKDALEQASLALGVPVKGLKYRLDPSHFSGGAETVKIEAWSPELEPEDPVARARSFLSGTLQRMGVAGTVDAEVDGDSIRVLLAIEDPAFFLGKGGLMLDALQHLANKALVRDKADRRIVVDLENYRERRDQSLRVASQKICEKVLADRSTITLKPMNAYDRRIVHLEVARHPGLASRSLGDGQLKRLQIFQASRVPPMPVMDPEDE